MCLVDHGRGSAGLEGRPHEIVSVVGLATDGEEEVAALDRTGVDRNARDPAGWHAAHSGVQRRDEAEP